MIPYVHSGSYRRPYIFLVVIVVLASGCSIRDEVGSPANVQQSKHVRHARGFGIEHSDVGTVVYFFDQKNAAGNPRSFLLSHKVHTDKTASLENPVIQVPVRRVVVLHAPYIAYFDFCGGLDRIVGLAETQYAYSGKIHSALESGRMQHVGAASSVDMETLVALDPDVVLTVGFPDGPSDQRTKIEALGFPVMVFTEWQEPTLLGRMEWVKIVGLLLDRESEAEREFQRIEHNYQKLADTARSRDHKPSVLCNAPYKGVWYVPGGDSYMGNLLRDAGASYLWQDYPGAGAVPLSLEQVFLKARDADVWINPGGAGNTDEIVEQDSRLSQFKPVHSMRIYNCDRRTNAAGANDYWESGLVRPDLILSDMLHIVHPDLNPGRQLVYYRKLNPRSLGN
jgi:iron complex transport system substrate-binding protein